MNITAKAQKRESEPIVIVPQPQKVVVSADSPFQLNSQTRIVHEEAVTVSV